VKLSDLVALYAGLARQGTTVPLTERFEGGACSGEEGSPAKHARSAPSPPWGEGWGEGVTDPSDLNPSPHPSPKGRGSRPRQVAPLCLTGEPTPRRLLDPAAAWYVGNILIGTPPPENAAGGRIAFKTGTSYGYRDAWSVGFDGKRTIGVWVGRPYGAPVPGLIGRVAAAPILFDAFARTGKLPAPLPPAPKGTLVAATGKLPPPLQRFRPGALTGESTEPQLRIMFPPNGARLELASDGAGKLDPIALKVTGGAGELTVLVNGHPLVAAPGRRTLFFEPDGPGFVRLTVMDAKGASDSVVVRLQ
jgi:penicillin-binding protein 1C